MYALRYFHYQGLLRQKSGFYAKYKTAFLEKNNFDVLFLGSSRVEMHYNTRIFDSLTGYNSFNLSLLGATPQVAFGALKSYLVNSSAPKYLIYEIDYHFLKHKSDEIKEFNNYFPFLTNSELRFQFNKIDSRINSFYINPFLSFPFAGFRNLSTSLHGWLNIPNKTDSLYYKGYLKEILRPALNYVPVKPYYTYFNVNERAYLDSLIQFSGQKNIHLILVSSPIFAGAALELTNKKEIIKQINDIANINKIQYFNLSSLAFCNQRNLFIDHYHLNYAGACIFTSYFCGVFNNKMIAFSLKK